MRALNPQKVLMHWEKQTGSFYGNVGIGHSMLEDNHTPPIGSMPPTLSKGFIYFLLQKRVPVRSKISPFKLNSKLSSGQPGVNEVKELCSYPVIWADIKFLMYKN
jgi:hypothetical protein